MNKIVQSMMDIARGQSTGLGLGLTYDILTKGYGGKLELKERESCNRVYR